MESRTRDLDSEVILIFSWHTKDLLLLSAGDCEGDRLPPLLRLFKVTSGSAKKSSALGG